VMVVGQPLGLLLTAPLVAGVGVRGGLAVCGIALLAVVVAGRHGVNPRETDEYCQPAADTLAVPLLAERS